MAVVGCSSWTVKSSYNPTAVSGQFRTYALLGPEAPAPHTVNQQLESEVARQLAAKGMVEVAPGQQPDVLVSYRLVLNQVPGYTQPGWFKMWGRTFGAMVAPPPLAYGYTERTLVIRFVDASTGRAFWHGSATSPTGGQATTKEVITAVDDILRKFPSQAVAAKGRPAG